MTQPDLFTGAIGADGEDLELVKQIQSGSREALELLISRHQPWIYNLVLRMLYLPQDAEDATQEILIKLISNLSAFEGRSTFRTWLYRIVTNHVLNMKRGRVESAIKGFAEYGRGLDETPDLELPDPKSVPADIRLLVEEARIGCTSGMLLCLDRGQRLIYILGEIFGVPDSIGSELLDISRENFRQKLARARRDLHNFMQDKCGLINTANPCRCAKKTQGFIKAGFLDPQNLRFAKPHVTRVRQLAPKSSEDLDTLDAAYAAIYRDHPFQSPPDFVAALKKLMDRPEFKKILNVS